jgi:hypothetical protein
VPETITAYLREAKMRRRNLGRSITDADEQSLPKHNGSSNFHQARRDAVESAGSHTTSERDGRRKISEPRVFRMAERMTN